MATPQQSPKVPRTCFISAPAGAPLDVLRATLESRGFRVLVPQELAVGTDWASEIQKQLAHADLVIGVLTSERQSPWVLFELGQASVLGRQIMLILPPKANPIPFSLHQFLVLRVELDNREAIEFALDQVPYAPHREKPARSPQPKMLTGLGAKADQFMSTLERTLQAEDWRQVERVVADVLRSSGVDLVVESQIVLDPERRALRPDFAVWSDVLEPFVGNPLLVEVKARIRGKHEVEGAIRQLTSYMDASGLRWALLLYGDGPEPIDPVWASTPYNVLVLPLRSLVAGLRTQAFSEIVRDLRNRRVHGSV